MEIKKIQIDKSPAKILLKPVFENLHVIKFEDFGEMETNDLLNEWIVNFNEYVKNNNIEIMSFDTENCIEICSFLDKCDLSLYKKKHFYAKLLDSQESIEDDNLLYKPISNIPDEDFIHFFSIITQGDTDMSEDYSKEYMDMVEMAGANFKKDNWKIVYQDSVKIGLVFPQLYPDDSGEGSIFYIGVLPEYRGKGLGVKIHSKGIEFLKNLNATKYVGSTLESNQAMNSVFKKNGCETQYTQLFYKCN